LVAATSTIATLLLPALPFITYAVLVMTGNIAGDLNRPSTTEVEMAIRKAQLDPLFPATFPKCEHLKEYLDAHLKTLLDYRNINNMVLHVGADNETRETVEFQE
jgi:hypothetical protein